MLNVDSQYDEVIEQLIPGSFVVFALTDTEEDEEMNAILTDVEDFELPDKFVRGQKTGGGVCAYALLNVLRNRTKKTTWAEALAKMHHEISDERGLRSHVPTMSMSRPMDLWKPIELSKSGGTKRALLIGVHYENEDDEDVQLTSCQDDVRKLREYLIHKEGFQKKNILVAMDDNRRHHAPNKQLILDSLQRLCEISKAGDSIVLLFSGHGGRLMTEDEYHEDGVANELLAPGDYRDVGVLTDDELYNGFTTQVPEGVHVVAVIDTCHPPSSGGKVCALEMPYLVEAGDNKVRQSKGFTPGRTIMASLAAAAGGGAAAAAATKKKKKKKDSSDGSKSKRKPGDKKDKKKKKKASNADDGEEEDYVDFKDPSNGDTEESSESEREKSKTKSKSSKKKKTSKKEEEDESEKRKKKKKKDGEEKKKKKSKKAT